MKSIIALAFCVAVAVAIDLRHHLQCPEAVSCEIDEILFWKVVKHQCFDNNQHCRIGIFGNPHTHVCCPDSEKPEISCCVEGVPHHHHTTEEPRPTGEPVTGPVTAEPQTEGPGTRQPETAAPGTADPATRAPDTDFSTPSN